MTIEEVRRDLPAVAVKFNNHLYVATVRGRLNPFATVYFELNGRDIAFEAAWSTVQNAVNNNGFIKY